MLMPCIMVKPMQQHHVPTNLNDVSGQYVCHFCHNMILSLRLLPIRGYDEQS